MPTSAVVTIKSYRGDVGIAPYILKSNIQK